MDYIIGGNRLNIRVWEFLTLAEPVFDKNGKETGEIVARDYVEYGPPHARHSQTTIARVDRILKATRPRDNTNVHALTTWARRELIAPLYEAWKKGEQIVDGGTPLAVLNFLRPEDVKILKTDSIYTVEDLANVHETQIATVRLPGMREKKRQAQLWLDARDTNKASAQIAAQGATIDEQAKELAQLREMINNLALKQVGAVVPMVDDPLAVDDNGDRIPKRRGRPPKAREEEEAA